MQQLQSGKGKGLDGGGGGGNVILVQMNNEGIGSGKGKPATTPTSSMRPIGERQPRTPRQRQPRQPPSAAAATAAAASGINRQLMHQVRDNISDILYHMDDPDGNDAGNFMTVGEILERLEISFEIIETVHGSLNNPRES